jgi:phosphonate transport system ATP-binding protein
MSVAAVLDAPTTAAASNRPAVSIRRLTKNFGTRVVLDGVDLDIAPGSAVALLGANGSGKSTLLRCLIGLIAPTAGQAIVLDREVAGLGARELARLRARVGMIWQKHNLVPRLSVLTNVVHGVQSRRSGFRTWSHMFAPSEIRGEALACLEAVGLADRAGQRADSLSGGQSQRVAVARMLMQRPEIVLADEPDASLDPRAGEEVMQTLHDLCKRKGLTLVFVSHRLEHAIRFSDRIIGLADGRIRFDKPAAASDPAALRAFFTPITA